MEICLLGRAKGTYFKLENVDVQMDKKEKNICLSERLNDAPYSPTIKGVVVHLGSDELPEVSTYQSECCRYRSAKFL